MLERTPRRSLASLLHDVLVRGAALVVALLFLWIVGDVVRRGLGAVDLEFLTRPPERAGRAGGISSVLVSTAWILAVALAVAVPTGLAAGVYLAELARAGGRFAGLVRLGVDLLAGVPSIVFGLFGNAFFCVVLGLGYSILSGGLTLACMVLPILVRSVELGLRGLPRSWRLAAASLGLSRWRTIVHVLLPAAAPGLAAGLLIGLGRASAETAALLFTSGYVDRMPDSLHDSGRALSLHVYDLAMNVPGGEPNAYGSALVLLVALLVVNSAALAATRLAAGRRAGAEGFARG